MSKYSKKAPDTQLALFQDAISKYWDEIRKVEIEGEMFYSVLDIFKFYGDSSNPTHAWKLTRERMKKQGYKGSNDLLEHHFEGQGQRATPIMNEKGFFRVAQATPFKDWEVIRDFMAQAAKEKSESARQRKQRETIEYMENAGLGDTSGVVMLKARYELNRGWDILRAEIFAKCESPKMGIIVNKEYTAVFGMVADELKYTLNTKSIRDALPLRQMQALTLAEGMLSDILARQGYVSNEQIYDAIQLAIVPIGKYLRGISDAMGIHHVTGKPLLPSGE